MSLLVKELIGLAEKRLSDAGVADAARDARTLYCYMLDISHERMILEYKRLLQDALCDEYFALIDRRAAREPLQYITGSTEFMGLPFIVDGRVLVPRQDTETLAEDTIELINGGRIRGEEFKTPSGRLRVLDLGTGSGAIGISVARLAGRAQVTCSDVSDEALAVARNNAELNGLAKSVEFVRGDLFEPFRGRLRSRKFDIIVSNPPYIRTAEIEDLEPEVRDHEPRAALDGGSDGLDCYRRIAEEAPLFLGKKGHLMLETGCDQAGDVCALLGAGGRFDGISTYKDLTGRDRVVHAALSGQ